MAVLNSLAPVILLIALGVYLGRTGFMPERKAVWVNQLIYWIGLPTLLFLETAKTEIDLASGGSTLLVVLAGMMVCIGAGYLIAWLLKLSQASTGAFVQAGFRGNLAYIGIPVILYSMPENEEARALCMLTVAGTIPFYNVAAVLVLIAGEQRFSIKIAGTVLRNLVKNPLILACAGGLAVSALQVTLPLAVTRTLEPLGRMALPLALLSIGVTLDVRKIRGLLSPVVAASLVKVALAPLAGWGLSLAVGLTGDQTQIALIMLATPTASASFIMADLMRSDSQLTSGVIVVSTILSLVSIMIITWVMAS